jgi:hypothetical protein
MYDFEGGCLCGKVRWHVAVEPLWTSHCHCEQCRRHTGAAVANFVGFPAEAVSWRSQPPARYRSSPAAERSFCAACGSTVAFHRVHETSLAIGGFDDPSALVTGVRRSLRGGYDDLHVYFAERIPWFDTADDWPRHDAHPEERAKELRGISTSRTSGIS